MSFNFQGAETDHKSLIRNTVLRSEIDMLQIKIDFQKRYSKSLESAIKVSVDLS